MILRIARELSFIFIHLFLLLLLLMILSQSTCLLSSFFPLPSFIFFTIFLLSSSFIHLSSAAYAAPLRLHSAATSLTNLSLTIFSATLFSVRYGNAPSNGAQLENRLHLLDNRLHLLENRLPFAGQSASICWNTSFHLLDNLPASISWNTGFH
jgi:hypothetical protein